MHISISEKISTFLYADDSSYEVCNHLEDYVLLLQVLVTGGSSSIVVAVSLLEYGEIIIPYLNPKLL